MDGGWQVRKAMTGVWRMLGRIGHHLFGDVHWQAPVWLRATMEGLVAAQRYVAAWIERDRRRATLVVGVVLAVAAAGLAGKWWYDQLPKPVEVTYAVKDPARTRIEDPNARPDPVIVEFSASVATLAGVGKEVTTGIQTSPAVEGVWTWTDDRTLVFQPKADWPVGGEFTVSLARKGLIAEQVRLKDYQFKFRAAPFVAELTEAQFYQDPVNAASKKIVAAVNFSHPVNPADFEKRIVLREAGKSGGFLGLGAEGTKFRVTYDKLKLNAFIHSEALPIPAKPLQVNLTVEPGVRAARGGTPTAAPLARAVVVPGLYSLAVQSADLTQADNERLEPDRILMVNVSADTHERELAGKLRVWLLPLYHPDSKEEDRKQPYHWGDPAKIGPEILKASEVVKLEPVASEREYVQQHAFKLAADAGRYLYVRVDKGVKSFGGYVMEKDYDRIARVSRSRASCVSLPKARCSRCQGRRSCRCWRATSKGCVTRSAACCRSRSSISSPCRAATSRSRTSITASTTRTSPSVTRRSRRCRRGRRASPTTWRSTSAAISNPTAARAAASFSSRSRVMT